jgi:hypothetical protein
MSIGVAFPVTPTIYSVSYGKIIYALSVFDLRARFEESNYLVNWEVTLLRSIIKQYGLELELLN